MNLTSPNSLRVILPAVTTVAALGIGAVWASAASADLGGGERERVGQAAVRAVGGGTVVDAETSDDLGEAFEVEVRKADGTEVDVVLDENLDVVRQEKDDRERDDTDGRDDDGRGDDGRGDDNDRAERPLTQAERDRAERAAVTAVGGGTVTDVEASDDAGEAYEVEVRTADGVEWDVELGSGFTVLRKHADD
jgi:uncharacterized membrane protein YkoI